MGRLSLGAVAKTAWISESEGGVANFWGRVQQDGTTQSIALSRRSRFYPPPVYLITRELVAV
jgi:hypothetical protein